MGQHAHFLCPRDRQLPLLSFNNAQLAANIMWLTSCYYATLSDTRNNSGSARNHRFNLYCYFTGPTEPQFCRSRIHIAQNHIINSLAHNHHCQHATRNNYRHRHHYEGGGLRGHSPLTFHHFVAL